MNSHTPVPIDMEKNPVPNTLLTSTKPQSHLLAHAPQAHHIENVATDPFLGRLGAGQRFTTSTPTASTAADSVRDPPWSTILSPADFRNARLWKLAVIEAIGTGLQVFLSGLLAISLLPIGKETSVGALLPIGLASLVQIFVVSLFVYSGGPVSGAHFNPLITMGTFCARLSSLPRTVLYVGGQCIGGVIGAYLVRAGLGLGASGLKVVPGCYVDSSLVTPAEAFTLEAVMCFVQLFLAFGLGLDPRNSTAFGPSLAPILIGLSSALTIFVSGNVRPGYLGTGLNPARCLGLMAAGERFTYHWVHWVGAIVASVFNGTLYWLVPPYEKGA